MQLLTHYKTVYIAQADIAWHMICLAGCTSAAYIATYMLACAAAPLVALQGGFCISQIVISRVLLVNISCPRGATLKAELFTSVQPSCVAQLMQAMQEAPDMKDSPAAGARQHAPCLYPSTSARNKAQQSFEGLPRPLGAAAAAALQYG